MSAPAAMEEAIPLNAAATPEIPKPSCVACTEENLADNLIQPCRSCSSEYCEKCLTGMFVAATEDASRMPPKCCTILQIHTASLPNEVADRYRAKFEEWITRDKLYCPSPRCSAFIPARLMPTDGAEPMTLKVSTETLNSCLRRSAMTVFAGLRSAATP